MLWMRNLSLHFALMGRSSFIAWSITVERTRTAQSPSTAKRKVVPRTRDLDGLARFYPPGVRPYTVKLQRGEGRPYSAPNLVSIACARAHLGGGRLDFECDGLRIVVRDLEGTFNRLGEWSWRGQRRAERRNAGSEYTEQARTRTRASVSVQQERLEEQGDALLNPRTLLGLSETDILAGGGRGGGRRGGLECGVWER